MSPVPELRLLRRPEDGLDLPYLVWELPLGSRVISSAAVGGGLGAAPWIINAQVRPGYDRTDLADHLGALASLAGLAEPTRGVGLLTAADVGAVTRHHDDGVTAWATVGIRLPTWAAAAPLPVPAPDGPATASTRAGTINVVAFVDEPVGDATLVNMVSTATEARAQALIELGVPGTGTATDSITIACRRGTPDRAHDFGGPRSQWGARLARSVHATVTAGALDSISRLRAAGIAWD